MKPVLAAVVFSAAIIGAGASALGQYPTAQAAAPPMDEQTISDAYAYLLGRVLVIRQEFRDRHAPGFAYNTIKYNPLGSADFVNPNLDVAYLEAWIAVGDEMPVILEVPEIKDRYYTAQLIDEWGEVIANINERTFPSKPFGMFALVKPGSTVPIPPGAARIELHSRKAKLLGRVELKGDPDEAVRLQHAFKLIPLGSIEIEDPPEIPIFDNKDLIGVEIFDDVDAKLESALDVAPNAAEMQQKVRAVAAYAASSYEARAAVDAQIRKTIHEFQEDAFTKSAPYRNHWMGGGTTGNYGPNFWMRTLANFAGIWANTPDEVIYFVATRDSDEKELNGSNSYVIHFPADKLPSSVVDAYWSVILVGVPDYRVVPNPLDRFNFNSYSPLEIEADGSLKIGIGPKPVPGVPESNWLPAPDGRPFSLTFRTYVPKDVVRRGEWQPAAVTKVASTSAEAAVADRYVFKQGYPTAEAAQQARDDVDFQRAVTAYRFWYPTVSAEGIFNGNRTAGIEDGKAMGISAAGPRQVGFTLNSDTPYGSAALDVKNGPVVIEMPPGPYVGLVDDHHQGWILDLGLPGPDGDKGGKHLILPPDYKGEIPPGYHVGRSLSYKVLLAVRALPVGGDVQGAMEALRKIKVYPLSSAANPQLLTFVDTSARPMDNTLLRWETNIQFWEVLHRIIAAEPVVEKFLPMYGLLSAIGIEKGKPFAPDPRMKAILERAAVAGRDQMLVSAFDSARPDRFAWPDRKWEWIGLVPGSAQFETPAGLDMEARERWFAQAIVTSPAMFRRAAGAGSLYWLAARDGTGAFLDGSESYTLAIPQPVPGKLFWSVTVYDAATRSEVQTDQDKAALRSMFELKDVTGAAPVDLYFGPAAPPGNEARWIKTIPGRGWFAYIRIYGPEQAAFDGSWKPGDFEEVK